MTEMNSERPSAKTNREHIQRLAGLADAVVIETIRAMAQLLASVQASAITNRLRVTVTLARASCDYARALIHLIGTDHLDLGGPSLSLLRTQLELALRASFFCDHASDKELVSFLKRDEMPKRRDAKGEWKRISLNELALIVEPTFAGTTGTAMSDAIKSSLTFLNGHVHGGTPLLRSYLGADNSVGFVPPKGGTVQTLQYSYAFANLALTVVAKASGVRDNEHCPTLDAPFKAATAFMEGVEGA